MYFDYYPFFVCLDPPPRAFAIFSLLRSRSSVEVPVFGVNAMIYPGPDRGDRFHLPLGKALFTVLMINSECTDRRAESSGSLTKTLFVLESRLLDRGWAGLFGRFLGVAPLNSSA
jgi:hypothetical protein